MGVTYNAGGKEINAFGRAVDEVSDEVTGQFKHEYVVNGVRVWANGQPVEHASVDRDELTGVPTFATAVADRAQRPVAVLAPLSPGELAQASMARVNQAMRDNPDLEPEAVAVLTAEIQADVQREYMASGATATAPLGSNPVTGSPLTKGQAEGLRAQTPDGDEQSTDPLVRALGSSAVAGAVRDAGFGDKEAIKAASDDELLAITGVGRAKVASLRKYAETE